MQRSKEGGVTVARIAVVHYQEIMRELIKDLLRLGGLEVTCFGDVDQLKGEIGKFDLVVTNWGGSERAGYHVPGGSILKKLVELMDKEGVSKPIVVHTGGDPSPEDKEDFPQVKHWCSAAEPASAGGLIAAVSDAIGT